MASRGQKEWPVQAKNTLTQHKAYVLFHGHFMALSCHGWRVFSRAKSSKTCTNNTSHIGKVKLAKPTAGQKINPCQACKAKLFLGEFWGPYNLHAANIGAVSLPFSGTFFPSAILAPLRSNKQVTPLAERE